MKDYLKQFNTTAEYNTYINGTPDLPNVSLTLDDNEVHYNRYIDYSKEYLTFEALQNGTFTLTVPAAVDSSKMTSISYSVDDGANWTTTTIDNTAQTITTPTINAGSKVLWKGVGNALHSSSFSSTGNFNVSGNIMSLLYGDNFVNQTTFPSNVQYIFNILFKDNTKVVSAENLVLPATTLANACYRQMFMGCTSLTKAPAILPATNLVYWCYNSMFEQCKSLTTAPEFAITTTTGFECCSNMFKNCYPLTTAPELTATTLAESCYQNMFSGCTSLTTAPTTLPATTLANKCYQDMFRSCSSLTTVPELPATTLTTSCYSGMFNGCRNINSITMLATDISAANCLSEWVQNVAATGTFTKAAEMTTIPTGTNGIPSGWTVVDA